MKVYHFCAKRFLPGIMRDGLTRGTFPQISKKGYTPTPWRQWLTTEPDASKQSWATKMIIPYSRTECRLEVDIPDTHVLNLVKATAHVKNMLPENRRCIEDWQGSDAWYIYIGVIPPEWITAVELLEEHTSNTRQLEETNG